jgi:hypothetical protein
MPIKATLDKYAIKKNQGKLAGYREKIETDGDFCAKVDQ